MPARTTPPQIRIEEHDFTGFRRLAGTLRLVEVYNKGSCYKATQRQARLGGAAKESLEEDFAFLLGLCTPQGRGLFPEIRPGYLDTYVCAVADLKGAPMLVGFSSIKHYPAGNLAPPLLDYMERLGNTAIREQGYDCTTATSVYAPYRGQGISNSLREATADCMLARHRLRGGQGPAVMKMSSMTTMGRQHLLRGAQRVAASRDVVLAYGMDDVGELGFWMDRDEPAPAPAMGWSSRL